MKKTKKVLAILLSVLLLTASFAACGQRAVNDDEDQSTPKATSTSTPEPTPEATPEATPVATPEATPEASNEVDADKAIGVIDGNLYTNELFKFTAEFPTDWNTPTGTSF